jgi:PAS domain S-box-containing protein
MADESDGQFAREARAELQTLIVRLEHAVGALEDGSSEDALGPALQVLREILQDARRVRDEIGGRAVEFARIVELERGLYRGLFDRAPDAYLVTDSSGTIVDANPAAAALFERKLDHIRRKPLPVLVAEHDRRPLRQALLDLVRDPVKELELTTITPSGERRVVEARATAETLRRDRAMVVRWILRDVTARRAAEEQVRALNAELERHVAERTRQLEATGAELETVVHELPQGLMIVDAAGDLQLANRRAEELLAPFDEMAEALRREPWPMFDADGSELDELDRPLVKALARGEATRNRRVSLQRPDGERVFFELSATPVREPDGRVASVILTFDDVSERERRERAERDFVTNAAHELQTPIAAITSAIEVLQAGAKHSEADREHFLAHIERAADRLHRLTRALLILARAQTKAEPPRREVLPLCDVLDDVAAGLQAGSLEIECDDDVAVVANRSLLEQALTNLGDNALKHAGGPVRIEAARANGLVQITVTDRGPGIPPAQQAHVFDRFYRDDEVSVGFGLGLAIVRDAVAALDGEVFLDSSPEGTRVSIVLPGAKLRTT